MGLLLVFKLETLPPPTPLPAALLRLQYEALGLNHVEEQLPNEVGRAGVGLLEARSESGKK